MTTGAAALKALKIKLEKAKDKKDKNLIKEIIADIKLTKGDRGAAEDMPKKSAKSNINFRKMLKNMQNAVPASRTYKPDTRGLNKGGIVKKNKGGLMVTPKRAKRGY
jgi:hypothetical protein